MLRPTTPNPARPHRLGFTLLESLLAMTILSVIVSAILHATVAGHQHLNESGHRLDACRLAEQLLEEVHARPYDGAGAARYDYHMADYHGLDESPGDLCDASGDLLPSPRQGFRRTVSVVSGTAHLDGLDAYPTPIRVITVDVNRDQGTEVKFISLAVEPLSP